MLKLRELIFINTNENIEILSKIDSPGSYSSMSIGRIRKSAIRVGIKYFPTYLLKPSCRPTFEQELQTLYKLKHPTISQVHGYFPPTSKNPFHYAVISEYHLISSLSDVLTHQFNKFTHDDWNPTRKMITIFGIAYGMNFLHQKGIIHGYLKPSNVVYDDDLNPHISDYFINLIVDGDQNIPIVNSTMQYSAPELFEIGYTNKVDVYSFGSILFQILTDQPLYTANQYAEYCKAENYHMEVPDTVEQPFRKLILQCLNVNPEERPSFQQIVDLLLSDEKPYLAGTDVDEFQQYLQFIGATYKNGAKEEESITVQTEVQMMALKYSALQGNVNAMYQYAILAQSDEILPHNYEEAVQFYQMATKGGHVEAPYHLAIHLETGLGIKQDFTEAAHYHKIAADRGFMKAMLRYGEYLATGKAIKRDIAEAEKYFKKATETNDPIALIQYSVLLMNGDIIPKDVKRSLEYLKRACDAGSYEAKYTYGYILYEGEFVQQDTKKGLELILEAANHGDGDAQVFMGKYLIESGDPKNYEQGIKYLKYSAEQHNANGCLQYAAILCEGKIVKPQRELGKKYLKEAADLGCPVAQTHYASMIAKNVHDPEAAKYFKLAADQGNAKSQLKYAVMLIDDEYDGKDYKLAEKYFKMAADQGDSYAQFYYGSLLYSGDKLPKNEALGAKYLKLSADQGFLLAQYNYAMALREGKGVKKNNKLSAYYFKLAAEGGDAKSQFFYGVILATGDGAPKKPLEAIKFIKMSAENGVANAQGFLGTMYEEGNGVKQDFKLALHYYELAASQGDAQSQYNYGALLGKGAPGVAKDSVKSAKFIKMSADQGIPEGQLTYATFLLQGFGVDKDQNEGIKYLKMAAAQGLETAKKKLIEVTRNK